MPDTVRTGADLLANLFQDGQSGGITAQDMRDLIVSMKNPYASMYVSTPADTTISAADTYYKAAGTTVLDSASSEFTMPSDNRILYGGTVAKTCLITIETSLVFASGTAQVAGAAVYGWDDSTSSGSLFGTMRGTAATTDPVHISNTYIHTFNTDDYIELHIANHTGTVNLQALTASIRVVGLFT